MEVWWRIYGIIGIRDSLRLSAANKAYRDHMNVIGLIDIFAYVREKCLGARYMMIPKRSYLYGLECTIAAYTQDHITIYEFMAPWADSQRKTVWNDGLLTNHNTSTEHHLSTIRAGLNLSTHELLMQSDVVALLSPK